MVGITFSEETVKKQQRAYSLAIQTIEVHYPDDPQIYDDEKEDARYLYQKSRGDLQWSGRVFLAEMLLEEISEEFEL